MPQYLLSIYQPDNGAPDADTMARIKADLHRLNEELRESGSWVFTGGLHAPSSATVVRADGMITDGPYLKGNHLFHAIRGDLLARLGRAADARQAFQAAARLTQNQRERNYLLARRDALTSSE